MNKVFAVFPSFSGLYYYVNEEEGDGETIWLGEAKDAPRGELKWSWQDKDVIQDTILGPMELIKWSS